MTKNNDMPQVIWVNKDTWKAIKDLEALGLLHCDRGTSQKTNAYSLPKTEIAIEIVCDLMDDYMPKACHLLKIFYPKSKGDWDDLD